MLPRIEVDNMTGTSDSCNFGKATTAAPLVFRINGHAFKFTGTSSERHALERDLNDARKLIEAASRGWRLKP